MSFNDDELRHAARVVGAGMRRFARATGDANAALATFIEATTQTMSQAQKTKEDHEIEMARRTILRSIDGYQTNSDAWGGTNSTGPR